MYLRRNGRSVSNFSKTDDGMCNAPPGPVGDFHSTWPRNLPEVPSDFVPFINIVGVWYQIRDDYRNLLDEKVSQAVI